MKLKYRVKLLISLSIIDHRSSYIMSTKYIFTIDCSIMDTVMQVDGNSTVYDLKLRLADTYGVSDREVLIKYKKVKFDDNDRISSYNLPSEATLKVYVN